MNKKNNHNKIIGIQFSILSPDEIRNGSVAEITNRDTYVNNKPVIATSSVDDYTVKETYNSVDFGDMIDVIKDYAFSGGTCPNPGDPLIIHLRIMSSNKTIYTQMANSIKQTLSYFTLGPEYSYENQGKNLGTTPISDLMGKIVFIADKSNPLFEQTELDE